MEITQVAKDTSAQQAMTYQKLAQQVATPAASDNNTLTRQAVQAFEKTGDSVQIKYTATSKNRDTALAIEQMHSNLNQLAKGVRVTNEGLDNSAQMLDQMQTSVQKIAKNFPPFTADSPERQKILMSYISIRKEIEKLMIPPPPSPVYEKVQGMWDSLFTKNGQINSAAIPALDTSSSDKQIKDASVILDKTGAQLSALSDSVTKALVLS